ncbi:MAG: hypothetical protein NW214_13280, partial [Pseudanabaenaceae cyanobacterium bins.39]|nr:hypothetical protein [Pseudanabaenaceae cyanobacterium bins.39]
TRGEGTSNKIIGSDAPRPLWERGWGEGGLSFVSQSGLKVPLFKGDLGGSKLLKHALIYA